MTCVELTAAVLAPYIPPIDPSNASDTQNFDDTFLGMEPVINDENEEGAETDQDRTDGEDSVTTPSQSRSPSVHPVEDDSVDVFDGYSFKGRHSVILDDEDEDGGDEDEDEDEEEESVSGPSLDDLLPDELATGAAKPEVEEVTVPEDVGEPKTPEARPAALPTETEAPEAAAPKTETATPRTSQDQPAPTVPSAEAAAAAAATRTAEDANVKTAPKIRPTKLQRNRREKSGIPALDKNLPERTDDEGATEREEDEDDWDFVEAGGMLVEERNGAKGTSLFARGVVDRYKLAVFRKSTPRRSTPRSFSGMSLESDINGSEAGSPSPSDKQRRGRTPGLTFRKHPKQFLRQKSPPPSSRSAKSLAHSTSATLSAASTVSSAGLLTPSASQTGMSPSLKSKESAISMGTTPSDSSDQSLNGDLLGGDTVKGNPVHPANGDEEKQQKNKVLKKYKEGAEKVLSIFQSPR